jgi:hypothetical protein
MHPSDVVFLTNRDDFVCGRQCGNVSLEEGIVIIWTGVFRKMWHGKRNWAWIGLGRCRGNPFID